MASWPSLIPPLLLFLIASITKNVTLSLLVGIISALLLVTGGSIAQSFLLFFERFWEYICDIDTIMLYFFLFGIGSIIALLTRLKDRYGPTDTQTRIKLRSKRAIENSTLFLSLIFSIDDYLSILSVSFVVRHFLEKCALNVNRFAYFIHSLAGPLVIMIPISSWAAAITAQLDQTGFHSVATSTTLIVADPLFIYLGSLPYLFYSIFAIFSVLIFVQLSITINNDKKFIDNFAEITISRPQLFDIFLPLILLLLFSIIGLLYNGEYYLLGGTESLIDAFSHNKSTFKVLCFSSWMAFFIVFLKARSDKLIYKREFSNIVQEGILVMYQACYVILLASIFGSFVKNDLKTGIYLAEVFLSHVSHAFIPFISFTVSCLITLVTGTAWGTFALMIPITIQMMVASTAAATPLALEQVELLFPTLGAILSGGVLGDNISLFSETTIMTASALSISPLQHAKSQIWYALPAIITSIMLYFLVGYTKLRGISLSWLLLAGFIICFGLLIMMQKISQKKFKESGHEF